MNGQEAAVLIHEMSDEWNSGYGALYDYFMPDYMPEDGDTFIVRQWVADEMADRCARSERCPLDVMNDFVKEMEDCLHSYNRRWQEESYQRFLDALTASIEITELFTTSTDILEAYLHHEWGCLV